PRTPSPDRRPVPPTGSNPARSRLARDLPELVVSLGAPLRRLHPPHCGLVQRIAGRACPSHSRHRGRRRQQRDGRSHRDDVCHPALARPTLSNVEGPPATKEPTDVLIRDAFRTVAATLAATAMTLAATSAYSQSPASPRTLESDKPNSIEKGNDPKDELEAVKAENAAVRELLRKIEEAQANRIAKRR